ncbi:pyrethroid hydrolase Ces2e-like [Porites lutea]
MAVMVWIHGTGLASFSSSPKFRGFSIGSSTEYPAHVLAGYNDVIVVTFNYRLGILGFLSSVPGTNKTGNYGMFDQIQALTWVHDNIACFGGDPDKVTVFGQGTGATSVALHLMSPKSKHLFQRAIMQSGAASAPYLPRKAANESVQKLAAAAKCPFNDKLIDCLRGKSAEDIIQLQSWISSKHAKALMELSNPVIDDDFLEESTQELYEYHKKGRKPPHSLLTKLFPNVKIMTGFTTHESSLDVIQRPEDARSSIAKTLKYGNIDNRIVDELVKYQYADLSDTKARDRMIESDFMTVAPMTFEAIALAEAERSVYFYVFEHRPDFSKLPELTGAIHGDDIGFVFGAPFAKISPLVESFTPRYSDIETGLSRYIMKLWTDFAKFG